MSHLYCYELLNIILSNVPLKRRYSKSVSPTHNAKTNICMYCGSLFNNIYILYVVNGLVKSSVGYPHFFAISEKIVLICNDNEGKYLLKKK